MFLQDVLLLFTPFTVTMFFVSFTNNSIQEYLGILAARCASCNCMTYFYCAPLQSCRRLYQLGGLTPITDTSMFLTTYRGGSHLPADIIIFIGC